MTTTTTIIVIALIVLFGAGLMGKMLRDIFPGKLFSAAKQTSQDETVTTNG